MQSFEMKKKDNPLFVVAADNWKNEVLALNKYGSFKSTCSVVDKLVPEFGHLRVREIEKPHIQRFIVKMSGRVSTEYIRHLLSAFKGIMEYADDNWDMPRRLKIPKRTKPKQPVYSFDECRKIFKYSSGQERVLWMLLAETGCRIGEALALQNSDVVDNVVHITKNIYEGVMQPTPKTENSERSICISNRLMVELEKLKVKQQNTFIFRSVRGRAAWPQQLLYFLRETCQKAGVEYKAFHAFRRGNITELLVTLQIPERVVGMRVGHDSPGMTLGVYCRPTTGADKVWVDKIAGLLYGSE